VGQQEKQRIHQNGRSRRPALSYLAGSIPESDKQHVYSAPDEEQPAPQATQPPASEPAAPEPAAPESRLNADEQPTPPRLPVAPKESPAPAPDQTRQNAASREQWKPPSTEETVGKFLSDIAEIAPPPVHERQESAPPPFFPIPTVSSEAASRKKASATPFLSEIQSATPSTSTRPKRPRMRSRFLRRRRAIWAAAIAGALVLIVLGTLIAFVLLRR
jgi:hypothetical protein